MFELQADREIGPMDQMFKPFFWCFLLCFPVASDREAAVSELLHQSLLALAAERPYLTGAVKRINESSVGRNHIHFAIEDPPSDIPIVFKNLPKEVPGWTDTYQQLEADSIPLRKLDSRILAPLTSGDVETRKVMAVQANFVEGGLLLAMCFHHNFVDGYGASRIIARFSEHCAGIAQNPGHDKMPEVLRYEHVQAVHRYKDLRDNSMLWRLNCLDWKEPPHNHISYQWPEVIPSISPPSDPPIVSTMFSFSAAALKEIKALAQSKDATSWVSSNDAFVAFLWRHIMRARFPWCTNENSSDETDRESRAVIALDGRKDLSIPESYIGNCVFHCYTDLNIRYVGSSKTPLSDLAARIRGSITNARSPELLSRVVGLAATIPDVSRIRYTNDNLGSDIYTTSWVGLPLYKLDWGTLGKIDYLRVPDRHFESLLCVLPPKDGTVELLTSMRQPDVSRLRADQDFTRFAKPM